MSHRLLNANEWASISNKTHCNTPLDSIIMLAKQAHMSACCRVCICATFVRRTHQTKWKQLSASPMCVAFTWHMEYVCRTATQIFTHTPHTHYQWASLFPGQVFSTHELYAIQNNWRTKCYYVWLAASWSPVLLGITHRGPSTWLVRARQRTSAWRRRFNRENTHILR